MDFEFCMFSLYIFIYCAYYLIDLRLIFTYCFAGKPKEEASCIHTPTDCEECMDAVNCPLKDKNVVIPKKD